MTQRLLSLLFTPELPQSEDPVEMRRYRSRIGKYLQKLTACIIGIGLVLTWAATPLGFVRAADHRELQVIVSELAETQKIFNRRLDQIVRNNIKNEIQLLYAKRCLTKDQLERSKLWQDIEEKQEEYAEVTDGKFYAFSCQEL